MWFVVILAIVVGLLCGYFANVLLKLSSHFRMREGAEERRAVAGVIAIMVAVLVGLLLNRWNPPEAIIEAKVIAAEPTVSALAEPKSSGSMPAFVSDISHGAWTIKGTDLFDKNPVVRGWLGRIQDPNPALWKTFPNIPNPDVKDFRVDGKQVPDGVEYGTYSSPYCFAHPCDIPVGAWEYRYISGDYQFLGTECKGDNAKGCMLVLINVMDQSFTWRGQDVDNGFTVRGRYWNGDALEWGIWGLVSHGAANMLNMPTLAHPDEVLNAGDPGNSGANCGNPLGCKSVDTTVIVHAGDQIIAVAKTTITK